MDTDLGAHFLERSRYFLNDEYRAKLRHSVASLPADAIWWRPNDESNSVGNLLIHLAGNIRCGFRKFWHRFSGNYGTGTILRDGRIEFQVFRSARRSIEGNPPTALEDAIENSGSQIGVVKDPSPVVHWLVGGEDHRSVAKMPIVDHVVEHVGGLGTVREISDLIDDEDWWVGVPIERFM